MPLLEVKIEKESRAVSANKPQQVTCRAIGSSPPPHISWWKAGTRLQATHETVRGKEKSHDRSFTFFSLSLLSPEPTLPSCQIRFAFALWPIQQSRKIKGELRVLIIIPRRYISRKKSIDRAFRVEYFQSSRYGKCGKPKWFEKRKKYRPSSSASVEKDSYRTNGLRQHTNVGSRANDVWCQIAYLDG